MKTEVRFPSNGLLLTGHLYTSDAATDQRRAAVVVSHPFGGVKEQTAGLYARMLATQGFVTLAFDASYQGESEGEPRFLENPSARAEDVRSAVTFLSTRAEVDPGRIGALGICASGAYVPYAAQTDHRIKAVATVSAVDIAAGFREGLDKMLDAAGEARTAEARGEKPRLEHIVPETDEDAEAASDLPDFVREAHYYYRTPRGQHPNAPNWLLFRSIDQIAHFSPYVLNHLIAPRPLLMIAGTKADTAHFSEEAIELAAEPKRLVWVEGATHVDLYDKPEYVPGVVADLTEFFQKNLATDSLTVHAGNPLVGIGGSLPTGSPNDSAS